MRLCNASTRHIIIMSALNWCGTQQARPGQTDLAEALPPCAACVCMNRLFAACSLLLSTPFSKKRREAKARQAKAGTLVLPFPCWAAAARKIQKL